MTGLSGILKARAARKHTGLMSLRATHPLRDGAVFRASGQASLPGLLGISCPYRVGSTPTSRSFQLRRRSCYCHHRP